MPERAPAPSMPQAAWGDVLFCEELAEIGESLEFKRIARGIVEKHGRLFTRFAWKARVRFDHEADPRGTQPVGKRLPFGGPKDDAEMRDGDVVAVDGIVPRHRVSPANPVGDDLVTVEVEVDPVGVAPSFRAAEDRAVEMACSV